MKGKLFYLVVAHGVVLEGKFTVREHKLGVVFLSAFNSPWGIDDHDVKLSNFLNEQIPVKVADIAVDVGISRVFGPAFVDGLGGVGEFLGVLVEVGVGDGEGEVGVGVVGVGLVIGDFVDGFGPGSQKLKFMGFFFFGR